MQLTVLNMKNYAHFLNAPSKSTKAGHRLRLFSGAKKEDLGCQNVRNSLFKST